MNPVAELQQVAEINDQREDSRPSLEVVRGLELATPPKMPKFAIDIDSTLYEFEVCAREAFQKLADETGNKEYRRGMYHPWDEWRSPADACGIDVWMDVIKMCHQPDVIERQAPYPGAVATLNALARAGYGLMYVSTRDPQAAKATENWLHKCGFPMGDHIEVHCRMEDKAPFIAECQYIIDDRPKTLVEFVYDPSWSTPASGERWGLGLMQQYNRALTDIPNIFLAPTWAGLSSWLARHKLLPAPTHAPLEA